MHEHLTTTPDILSPKLSNSADLARVAVASTIEQLEASEIEAVDVGQREPERKKNTSENLRKLQQRFGERFVKGNLMEGGGYTGGAARELLAGFMDKPGFASELKRLIPNKHGALRLLKDNQAYIQATLEQLYKDDPAYEAKPVKDPYELARSVGYELTGPFESTDEFVLLDRQDFRPNERLCTFNNPGGRLAEYNILWLRHAEVDETLPADRLTADNLSNVWKTYLKTIGRYDKDSNSYDLDGLQPSRDDPYGTSSMSVQISRERTHVSIKNRYNHTVGNPDNTLDSNLDNVAYGLKHAIYSQVGREDLLDKSNIALAEEYTTDNDGGIHTVWYEENNIYYGSYEYIENGVVTAIDHSKYLMLSPQLYVATSQKGEEVDLRPKVASGTELAIGDDRRFLDAIVMLENGTLDGATEDDKEFFGAFYEKDPLAIGLRRVYAERDRAELAHLIPEALREQAKTAYGAYQTISERIGISETITEEDFIRLIERKVAEWRENGTVDYLIRELYDNYSQPNLVATPNVLVDSKQIEELMVALENDRGDRYTFRDTHFAEKYSPEELSGKLVDGPLKLSIFTTASMMESGTLDDLKEQLRAMQIAQPNLNFRVPSVFEDVVFGQTLRERGTGTYHNMTIHHFDLPARSSIGLDPSVPTVEMYNQITIQPSSVNQRTIAGRLAVG